MRQQQVVAGAPGFADVPALHKAGFRQQQIGIAGAGREEEIAHHDKLDLAFIFQHFHGLVDVRVLVRQIVAREIKDEFDVAAERFSVFQTVIRRHFRRVIAGLHPVHDGDFRRHRVRHAVGIGAEQPVADAAVACRPAAFNPDVAGDRGKQRGAARGALAADMALRPPALNQRGRSGGGVVARQLANGLRGHMGNTLRPLRRFFHAIFLAEEVRHQRFARRYALGHRIFIKADGVARDKRAVMQVFADDDEHHCVHQRIVGGGQQRHPLVGERRHSVGVARIDHDKPGAVALHLLKIVIGVAEDGFVRVVAPEDHKLCI
ncbi:hypothetical protein BN132_419 [Cronobacter turicensis 564]|nr:hypothetical protein BN132_419 [Cronobacter turicensis 564]